MPEVPKNMPPSEGDDLSGKSSVDSFAEEYAKKVKLLKQSKGDAKAGIESMIRELEYLVNACPMGPQFLGRHLKYEVSKGWFGKKSSRVNLTPFKQAIQNTEKARITTIRQELEGALKKHPSNAELHALHAIQVYQDINQAGVRTNKLTIMRTALMEISLAVYNGADQITYAIWLVNIYLAYLEYLKDRILRTLKMAGHIPNPRIIELRRILQGRLLQLTFLQGVKEKMVGVNRLATLLKGTIYVNESVTIFEIKAAAQMLLKGTESQNVKDTKKKASHLLYIYFTLTLLYANMPIFKEKVKENLKLMPEIHRDIILQKRMIIAADGINEFKAELYSGYNKEAKESASKLIRFLNETIKEHLETAIMTKQFEIDPYIKIAWLTLEARDLFPLPDLQELLGAAREGLEVLFTKRCQIKGASEQARELYNALTDLELHEESRKRNYDQIQAQQAQEEAEQVEAKNEKDGFDMPISLRS